MRVLVFTYDFPSQEAPGPGVFVLRQVQAFIERGIEARVVRVVPHAPPLARRWRAYRRVPSEYVYEGVAVKTLRAFLPPRMFGSEVVGAQIRRALLAQIASFGADAVHVHTVVPCAAYLSHLPVPLVVTAHGSDAYDYPWRRPGLERAARAALGRAAAVVCVSDFVRGHVRRLGRRDASVVYNGADERTFTLAEREPARLRLGLPRDGSIVAFAGGLLRSKGVLDLIAAARVLVEPRPLFAFAGDGPERPALEYASRDLPIRLLGSLSHTQLADLFNAADAVALPSYGEGLPVALCEAMACGRAIVATRVGGIPEIVRPKETGELVDPGDVPALADALRFVLANEGVRARYGEAAAAFASSHLTWRRNAEAYERLFAELLERWTMSPLVQPSP